MRTHINKATAIKMGFPVPEHAPAVIEYEVGLAGASCATCAALRAEVAAQRVALTEARAALVKTPPEPVKQPEPEKPADEKPRVAEQGRKPR